MAGNTDHECLQGEVFGVEMPFIIQAKDTCNNKRSSGGDLFTVSTLYPTHSFSLHDCKVTIRKTLLLESLLSKRKQVLLRC